MQSCGLGKGYVGAGEHTRLRNGDEKGRSVRALARYVVSAVHP